MKYQKAPPSLNFLWNDSVRQRSRLWSHTNSSPQGPMWKENVCPSFSAVFSGDWLCLDLPNRESEGIFKQQKETNEYWVNRPPQQFLLQPHTATHRDDDSHVLFCLAVKVCSQALKQAFMVCLQALTALSMTANVQTEKVKCLDALMKCHKFCQCRSRLKTVVGLMIRHVVITAVQANRRDSSLLQTSQ